jgi:hypothetical protein
MDTPLRAIVIWTVRRRGCLSYSRLEPHQEYRRHLRYSDFYKRNEAFRRAVRRLREKLWALHDQLPADNTVHQLYSEACVALEKLAEQLEGSL